MRDAGIIQTLRQRILLLGVQTLTPLELLAVLLGDGPTATRLARRLLTKFRNLHTLARCSPQELTAIGSLSIDNAVKLVVAFELARQLSKEVLHKIKVDTPEIVCQLVAQDLAALHRESLRVILLDTKMQLLRIEEVSLGSLNESLAHPREIFRPALIHSAYAMILVHNHPSGDPKPSQTDRKLTRRIANAGKLLGVELADHVIIGKRLADKKPYFSFKDAKLL